MARKKSRSVLGVKITKGEVPEEEWKMIHKFAVSLERGRFNEYIELLQNTKQLLWKSFLQGLAKGFGAVVGATLVVALLALILAGLGKYLPGKTGDFFQDTGKKFQQPTKK